MTTDAIDPDNDRETIAPSGASRRYTAVVVFHGMGQQRHYESVWRIVESLDAWIFARAGSRDAEFIEKRLLLKARRERLRDEAGQFTKDDLVYIEASHAGAPGSRRVRFYEGYWAPATVGGARALRVLTWLMAQITRPLKVMFTSWRSFNRLRRADLLGLQRTRKIGDPDGEFMTDAAQTVLARYAKFVERRPPEPGSFASFLRYIKQTIANEQQRAEAINITRLWRWRHYWKLARSTALLLMVVLSVASLCLLVVLTTLELLRDLAGWMWLQPALARFGISVEADLGTALSVVALLAVASGVTGFLRDAVGDVQQFVMYQEVDALHERRTKILEAACKTLRHVLADERCDRVVVFAHSLGSAVALDTILNLRAFNQCAAPTEEAATHMKQPIPLNKIEHFMTCGSPIDKITFFFSTIYSNIRSFERMADDLRGDIGDIPFSKAGRQPHIHWVNFWDRGDPISAPIETVMPATIRKQRVDNVRIASLAWPDVAASHDAYFENPSVVRHLYSVAFLGASSFASPPKTAQTTDGSGGRPIYHWLGPGRGSATQTALLLLGPSLMVALIWTAIGALFPHVVAPRLEIMGLFAAVLFLGALAQRMLRPRLFIWKAQRLRTESMEASMIEPGHEKTHL